MVVTVAQEFAKGTITVKVVGASFALLGGVGCAAVGGLLLLQKFLSGNAEHVPKVSFRLHVFWTCLISLKGQTVWLEYFRLR
jgi:hypothetical protein